MMPQDTEQEVGAEKQEPIVPGPNAFAIAERQKQKENEASHSTHSHVFPPPRTSSWKSRTPGLTALNNLLEQARSPPKQNIKDDDPFAELEKDRETYMVPTARNNLEARTEKKYFKMMGHLPPDNDDGYITTQDLRKECKVDSAEQKYEGNPDTKTPKKMFGLALPSFKSSNTKSNNPIIPMVSDKAAKVLGTTPEKPTEYIDHRGRISTKRKRFMMNPETMKPLPPKMVDHHSHVRRPSYKRLPEGRSLSRSRHSPRKFSPPPTPPKKDTPPVLHQKTPEQHKKTVSEIFEDSQNDRFSSPPMHEGYGGDAFMDRARGSPSKLLSGGRHATGYYLERNSRTTAEGSDSTVQSLPGKGRKLQPTVYSAEHGGIILQPTVYSPPKKSVESRERGNILPLGNDSTLKPILAPENIAMYRHPANSPHSEATIRPTARSPQRSRSSSEGSVRLLRHEEIDCSGQADSKRLMFAISSSSKSAQRPLKSNEGFIPMMFQGEASEIDPNSSTGKIIQSATQGSLSAKEAGTSGGGGAQETSLRGGNGMSDYHQAEQYYSQSADKTPRASPGNTEASARADSNRPNTNRTSIHPTPEQLARPTPRAPPRSLDDHFYMTNEHFDVSARILYELIDQRAKENKTAVNSTHGRIVKSLEHHVADIKSHINFLNEKTDRTSNQVHGIENKLDKFMECIKTDLVEPLAAQTKSMAEMERNVKGLQQKVHELQKSVDKANHRPNPGQSYPAAPAQSTLAPPAHQAQSPFVGYNDTPPQIPSAQESRVDTRYRYGYGQSYGQGHRGPPVGRDEKGDSPFANLNPYNFGGNGHLSAYGYQGYGYSANGSEQPYSNQGGTK